MPFFCHHKSNDGTYVALYVNLNRKFFSDEDMDLIYLYPRTRSSNIKSVSLDKARLKVNETFF